MSTAEGRKYIRTEKFKDLKAHVLDVVLRGRQGGAVTSEIVRIVNNETPISFQTYSNPVSGALSRLHNTDLKIVRLRQKRDGFYVYVGLDYIDGRDYYRPKPPKVPEGEDGALASTLDPRTVLDVIEAFSVVRQRLVIASRGGEVEDLKDTLNAVWAKAREGDVKKMQEALDSLYARRAQREERAS